MTAATIFHPKPDVEAGLEYWHGVEATVNGVLGGYGDGSLPRIDAQGSRSFLLRTLPRLSAVAPVSHSEGPAAWTEDRLRQRGGPSRAVTRALDCGAGVGRVSRDVLSRIVDRVHLVEPARHFLVEAQKQARAWPAIKMPASAQPFLARKEVHFHLATLQAFDPARPWASCNEQLSPVVGASATPLTNQADVDDRNDVRYDVIWCQWCLQHLSDADLFSFLRRCKRALLIGGDLDETGAIFVKENVCQEGADGGENVWWDDEDKSITRSANAYERIFREAGLSIIRSEVQHGLPEELFTVKMWALR